MEGKGKLSLESICGGLPEELCVQISSEQQIVKIKVEKRKFGKEVTVIEGLDSSVYNLKEVASRLKSKLAVGGTVKNNHIELQGNQKIRVKQVLIEELGIPPENIITIESE
ncbi:MAG: stress response translation initiation inhibitor YciH [Sulfolobales archaeon]|nr:stress response translation initiation inhibitor YciH [Sulfolobales archaeon]MDW8083490.1 stress response translation initiation inhibitor YciH [Sulfolobales archaeon]